MARTIRVTAIIIAILAMISLLAPWYSSHLQDKSLKQAEMGFQAQALHTAERAVSLNPLSVDALFILAGAQQRLGREEAARDSLVKATELQPENYETWRQLAIYERDFWDEPELAAGHFQKAIELNPNDSRLLEEAEGAVEPAGQSSGSTAPASSPPPDQE